MKRLSLVFLIFVILISGCIGGGGPASTDGIVIKDFSFDYSPIYAGEEVGLTLEVQNIGEEIGELRGVTIYGIDYQSGDSSQLSWGLPTDDFEMTTITNPEFATDPLYPPDPITGFEGDMWYNSWVPQAPTYIRTPTDYTFDVRVEYSYSTTYTGTIRIIDNDYLRTLAEGERDTLVQQGGIVESSITGGPLSLAAASGRHFIVRSTTPEERTIKFKISNVGSGFPYNGDLSDSTKLYEVRVSNVIPSPDFIICDTTKPLRLSRGRNGVLSCRIIVPGTGPGSGWTNKLDKKFSITLDYEYYIDGKTSVTVNPTYEDLGGPSGTGSCGGTPNPCSTYSGDYDGDGDVDVFDVTACNTKAGCSSNGYPNNICSGTPAACSSYGSSSACTNAGCTWS